MNGRKSKIINYGADEIIRLEWKLLHKVVDFKQRQENTNGGLQHAYINPRRIAKKTVRSMILK